MILYNDKKKNLILNFVQKFEKAIEGKEPKLKDVNINIIECSVSDYLRNYNKNVLLNENDESFIDSPFMEEPVVLGQSDNFNIYCFPERYFDLTLEEKESLMLHEFGHIVAEIKKLGVKGNKEEMCADSFAASLTTADLVKAALQKLHSHESDENKRKKLEDRIRQLTSK